MYQLSNSGGYVTHPDCVFISVRLPPCAHPAHTLTAAPAVLEQPVFLEPAENTDVIQHSQTRIPHVISVK